MVCRTSNLSVKRNLSAYDRGHLIDTGGQGIGVSQGLCGSHHLSKSG